MTRILMRAHQSPFAVEPAQRVHDANLIGNNVGNLVFSHAVHRLLSTAGTRITTSRLKRITGPEVDDRFDRLVLPLANAFRPPFVPNLDAMSELVERTRVPVSVLGVGAQADLEGAQVGGDALDAAVRRFVGAVLDRSPSIGVRGEYTASYLRRLGFGDEHVAVVGCPSMFLDGPNLQVTPRIDAVTAETPIAFNASPYLDEVGPLSVHHAARYPHLHYVPQDRATLGLLLDGEYVNRWIPPERAGDKPVTATHPLVAGGRTVFPLSSSTWIDLLRGYDFSFGTRIHGNVVALLAGTPAVVLAHDSRTLELADLHQIPYRLISEVGVDVDAADLFAGADWGPMNRGHAERWRAFSGFLESHGLEHVFSSGQSPRRFDDKLAAADLPAPVWSPAPAPASPPSAI
ncbi:polysaccharide pyruvyl transferase family protein [Solicola sp. PLA-1-18]|uniref:polysaccharide pyruvyl transferase family protein n=1 Tax=Solicola sp. PLA-1-18 TaxID=3380532 RepID=UPI003B8235EC